MIKYSITVSDTRSDTKINISLEAKNVFDAIDEASKVLEKSYDLNEVELIEAVPVL